MCECARECTHVCPNDIVHRDVLGVGANIPAAGEGVILNSRGEGKAGERERRERERTRARARDVSFADR